MTGFPSVVADNEFMEGATPREGRKLFRRAWKRLPDEERVLSLAASTGGEQFEDIIRTNSFGLMIGNRQLTGLYPEISVGNWFHESVKEISG